MESTAAHAESRSFSTNKQCWVQTLEALLLAPLIPNDVSSAERSLFQVVGGRLQERAEYGKIQYIGVAYADICGRRCSGHRQELLEPHSVDLDAVRIDPAGEDTPESTPEGSVLPDRLLMQFQ